MTTQSFIHLLSPLKIGSIETRNRVLVSAHVPGLAKDNKPGADYINYHRNYARAGVGLQITGGTPIHRSGMLSLGSDGLWNLDDSIIPGYQALALAVHEQGGRILAQLAHSAGTVLIQQPMMANWAASATCSAVTGGISHAMNTEEIQEVLQAYRDGAKRVIQGNLDGIEILAAFGFLPHAFLSPLTNLRKDKYGGSLENRMRFTIELLSMVREEIGPKPILGVRIPGDEFETGGLNQTDMQEIATILSATGLIDYISVIAHTNMSHSGRAKHWAPTPAPHGLFVGLAAGIRNVVKIPVFAVGRITDPAHAERVLQNGDADMIGMTRAHISDSEIVSKLKRNAADEIRPCVGTNNCIANRYLGKPIRCIHNPHVGKASANSKLSKKENIFIIGAGPAGLEAARVAAEQGHKVEIHEQYEHAGGQLALWARSPGQVELSGIINWRLNELKRLGVHIQYNSSITVNDLGESKADRIIIATGARANLEPMRGDNSIQISTPHDVLKQQISIMGTVVVVNDGRGQAGLAAAEWLAHQGAEVMIITSDIAVAADIDATNRHAWYSRLGELGCQMIPNVIIHTIYNGAIELKNLFADDAIHINNISVIIDWRGCRSDPTFQSENQRNYHLIGDCLSPRNVEQAIQEGANVLRIS